MSKGKSLRIRNSTAEFLIFTRQAGDEGIEVRVAEETVWLTQKLISVLFDKGRSTITEHLKNIFENGELDEKSVCRDFRHAAEDGKNYTTRFYNLDAIIAEKKPKRFGFFRTGAPVLYRLAVYSVNMTL